MPTIYLGLGVNLGNREAALQAALEGLAAGGVRITRCSSIYETEPVGLRDQPWFLNLVAEGQTDLTPDDLLALIHRIEGGLGRTRQVRWGPRTVDIDILLYGTRTVASEALQIPHPELANRRFVLEPLAELEPGLVLPGGRTVEAALDALGSEPIVKRRDVQP